MANWAQKLKLHHLQMLVALGEQGNLTHVARMMNISQPALSKWLSQLEDEIGLTLFERHSKGLRPSEGGKLLLQHAQRLINDLERSQSEIARFKQGGLVGSLKIGCSPVATDCVSQAILSLLQEMPTLHLNIEEKVMTPLLHDLLAGAVDVVVGRVGGGRCSCRSTIKCSTPNRYASLPALTIRWQNPPPSPGTISPTGAG
ncbi:hypothetical protein SERRSCBI_16225 [Serratia sp. SCBI]|nr:hypothetical protein SERRSCBI_16225 [Serratia sp. SCBI]